MNPEGEDVIRAKVLAVVWYSGFEEMLRGVQGGVWDEELDAKSTAQKILGAAGKTLLKLDAVMFRNKVLELEKALEVECKFRHAFKLEPEVEWLTSITEKAHRARTTMVEAILCGAFTTIKKSVDLQVQTKRETKTHAASMSSVNKGVARLVEAALALRPLK